MIRDKIKVAIPVNLKTKSEIFDGYGLQEFLQTVIISFIGIIIALIYYLIKKNDFIAIFIGFVFTVGGFMITIKDHYHLSILDQIRISNKFNKSQKLYKYKAGGVKIDEFIGRDDADDNTKKENKG